MLLVSGSKVPERWVVPGGGIEPSEDTCVAALREVQEEAGVKGTLGRLLGVFEVIIPSFTVVEFIGDHCQKFPEDLIENFS